MGRWRTQPSENLAAVVSAVTPEAEPHGIPSGEGDAVVGIDEQLRAREERLRGALIHLEGLWSQEARDHAIRLRLRTSEPQIPKNDQDAFGELARYLQGWAVGHGYLDPVEALRGSEIARWVASERAAGTSHGTIKTRRGRLVEVARLYHPDDFRPGRSESAVAQTGRLAPVPEADMVLICHYAAMAPDELRERFEVILAVVPWTGARSSELRRLRGTDIRGVQTRDGQVAVVTLTNPKGRARQVPVVDQAAAARLLELAAARGGMPVIRAGERNALNRCREYLLRRGVTVEFTVDRLRSAWLVRLARMHLPLAHALYLADTWDTRIYMQIQEHLPVYDPDQSIDLLVTAESDRARARLGGAA